jgi:hypothetical protein
MGDLSKTTSFLLNQIAQQTANAQASNCRLSFPPIIFVHPPSMCSEFCGGVIPKVIHSNPKGISHNSNYRKGVE